MSTNEAKETVLLNPSQEAEVDERMISRRTLIKVGWTAPIVAMALVPNNVFAQCSVTPDPEDPDNVCTRTQGWYTQHEDWYYMDGDKRVEIDSLTFGTGDPIARGDIIAIMLNDKNGEFAYLDGGDKRLILFQQVVAAKINRIRHSPDEYNIDGNITAAESYLTKDWYTNPYAPLTTWEGDMLNLKNSLEYYNKIYDCSKYPSGFVSL